MLCFAETRRLRAAKYIALETRKRVRPTRAVHSALCVLALWFTILASGQAIGESRTLRVGVYQNEPKVYWDPAHGPRGFYPEIIERLSQSLGWRIIYVPCDWSDCLNMLEAGDIDVMPDVAYSQERARRFQFGHEAVLHSWSYIYSRSETVLSALEDLDGRRVAILQDGIQHRRLLELAEQRNWTLQLVPSPSPSSVLERVRLGEADYGIVNRFYGELHENLTNERLDRSQVLFRPAPLYFAFANAVTDGVIERMDAELADLKSSPHSPYHQAYQRWLVQSQRPTLPDWALWCLAILAAVLGGSFLANAYFKKRIAQARASLAASNQRFHDFAKSSTDWFWEMDEQLRFSFFSERFEMVTGVVPTQLLGKTREETGIPGVDPASWQNHLDDLKARRAFRDFVHPRVRPDGTTVHLAISGVPVFDETGRFLGYRGTGRDITRQKQSETALAAALKEAASANRAKSEFLATMSHDLRTPLNAILGFSDLMRQQILGPLGATKYRDYAEDINASAAHLLDLVNDLLDLSRIETGNLKLDREPLQLFEIVSAAARTLDSIAENAGVTISVQAHEPESLCSADRRAIEQITLNLLSNSIRHTAKGGSIQVTLEAISDGGAKLIFADDGCGIEPDALPKLFEPYERANPLRARPYHGHGLGLPICKRLVEAHGGTIALESALGVGTIITIALPAGDTVKAGETGGYGEIDQPDEPGRTEDGRRFRLARSA